MRKISLCFGLFLLLAACSNNTGPAYHNVTYTPPATPGGRLCVNQCAKSRDYCRESCDLDNRACVNDVQAAAQGQYDSYAQMRYAEGQPVTLLPSDFEHTEACAKTKKSCYADCMPDYNDCYKSCGGAIVTTTSCQFLCFE